MGQFLADQVEELIDLSLDLQSQLLKRNPLPKDFAGKHRALVHAQQTAEEIAFKQIVLDMSHPQGHHPAATRASDDRTPVKSRFGAHVD